MRSVVMSARANPAIPSDTYAWPRIEKPKPKRAIIAARNSAAGHDDEMPWHLKPQYSPTANTAEAISHFVSVVFKGS